MSLLPPPLSNASQGTSWRELYRAAIREVDPSKLAHRIAEAGCAMVARANDLLQDGSKNCEEAEDLNDALHALRALSNNLKFSTSVLHRRRTDDETSAACDTPSLQNKLPV
jgi:hypothetical protein